MKLEIGFLEEKKMGYWEKAQEAEANGEHVAAVVYGTLYLEQHQHLDYHETIPTHAIAWLQNYRKNLKKTGDQQAIEDLCVVKFGGILERAGYNIDITAKIEPVPLTVE